MVSRSAYTQLRHSPVLLVGTVAGLVLVYLVPPLGAALGLATGDRTAAALGASGWAAMSASYLPMLRWYELSAWRAATLPLVAGWYAARTVESAGRYWRGRGGAWKGRVAAPAPAQPRRRRIRAARAWTAAARPAQ
jgi:hypothetical protein